jgi:hypothetical protein
VPENLRITRTHGQNALHDGSRFGGLPIGEERDCECVEREDIVAAEEFAASDGHGFCRLLAWAGIVQGQLAIRIVGLPGDAQRRLFEGASR